MTMRHYQALAVACPDCGAKAGEKCWDNDRALHLSGVHRRRDLAFNAAQSEPDPAGKRAGDE